MTPKFSWLDRCAVGLAAGLGSGWSPRAPGTCGALVGVPLAWAMQRAGTLEIQAFMIVGLFLVGVVICQRAMRVTRQLDDPQWIVLDEIVTVPITFFGVAINSWWIAAAGFGLHRLFDITKPVPTKRVEYLPGAWGVMCDDVVAGIYSNLSLRLVVWLAATATSSSQ